MSRGRGRGRGRGKPFGNLSEALGITMPGEPPPPPILTPPPLFPPLERSPLKLRDDSVDLLTAKQELRQFMKQSPFFLKASSGKVEIERYSDKYKQFKGTEIDDFLEWHPDWKFFPSELQIGVKRRKRTATDANFRPLIPAQRHKKGASREQGADKNAKNAAKGGTSASLAGKGLQKKVTFAAEPPVIERCVGSLHEPLIMVPICATFYTRDQFKQSMLC